ncbi:MAG: UvrD-helicase domain-containing protein [Actinomycetota bacterium]
MELVTRRFPASGRANGYPAASRTPVAPHPPSDSRPPAGPLDAEVAAVSYRYPDYKLPTHVFTDTLFGQPEGPNLIAMFPRNPGRPAHLGDITILVPARTSLPFLEDALDRAGIPYRAESSSLIYAGRAVRDLLMVLIAVDDPTNYLHIVSALRTPLMGCGDDDLFRFRVQHKGRWSYLADQPDAMPADDPVLAGLRYLRQIYETRHWCSPCQLLDRIARDRRAMELGFIQGRPSDVWRRLRFVIDQARAWSESAGESLRQYLHWVQNQSAEGARVQEAILPETDDDAVRIMTIHTAKGLEFPITILSGMSTVPLARAAAAEVVFPPQGEPGYRFGTNVQTDEYLAFKPIDEQMGYHERIRLLYVACTRARDHLVVSTCRKQRARPPEDPSKRTNAELLRDGMGSLFDELPDAAGVMLALPDPELAAASRPTAVAATALGAGAAGEADPGLKKRPRDMDLPPWLKGRYGTAVGRAVHGALQTIDLTTGKGLKAAVAAQCEAEAIPDREGDVAQLVGYALESPSVMQAARSPHWREVYACAPIEDGRLLEGYIDLLYRAPDGLVVVDYKTASSSDSEDLDRRLEGYRLQGRLTPEISPPQPASRWPGSRSSF